MLFIENFDTNFYYLINNLEGIFMDERIFLAVFLMIFLTIYGAINYYVLFKLSELFQLDRNITFYLILIILIISYLLANFLASSINSMITKAFYYIAATYMGMVFITFCLLLLYDIISLIKPMPGIISGIIVLCLMALLTIYSIINANTMQITTINLKSSKLVKPLNIVQISDVHLGIINGKQFLSRIIEKTNSLNPDIVLITGDLIDGRFKYDPKDFQMLNNLKGDVYFTIGNHETYAGIGVIEDLLKNTKVKMLRNELHKAGDIDKEINIIGIDDSEDALQVRTLLKQISYKKSKYNILMYHRPTGYKDAAAAQIDLMLSGHTHGGQIYPFHYLITLVIRPVSGLHHIIQSKNNQSQNEYSYLYISDGIGTWGPPMRLGTKAELSNIIINPDD
jgi:predicted MPP superfamily phosphohydrolase